MEEIRTNNKVELIFDNGVTVYGVISDYTINRIEIIVDNSSVSDAKKIKDLDSLIIVANTEFGIKKTYSSVISRLDGLNRITIENNPTIPVIQKRAFVRINSDIIFKVQRNSEVYNCECLNISGGGVAFCTKETVFNVGEEVKIIYDSLNFEKEIVLSAVIHRVSDKKTTAKYININQYDEAKIVKYVFNKTARRILK